jgi:hypothetical protein
MSASVGGRMTHGRHGLGDHRDVCGPDPAAPARDSRARRYPLPRLPGQLLLTDNGGLTWHAVTF